MSAPIQTLAEWLNIATEDLCATAKERIKLEIGSHFQDAVEAYQTEGYSEQESAARTLADLGDASTAAKRFRKSHLTEEEAELLQKHLKSYRAWYWQLVILFLSYGAGYYLLRIYHIPLALAVILALVALLLTAAQIRTARKSHDLASVCRFYTLDVLQQLNAVIFGVVCFVATKDWMPVLIVLSGPSREIIRLVYCWFKIRRVDDLAGEMLPPRAET